jgi:predicted RNase H-like nuclease (RuvC/YqgF family)
VVVRLGEKLDARLLCKGDTSARLRTVSTVAETDEQLSAQFLELALRQRETLTCRIAELQEKAEALRARADTLEAQATQDAALLREIEDVLDLAPQLRVDLQTEELRGKKLRQVAVEILRAEVGAGRPIHYRDWFRLVRNGGHRVAGTNPLASFLTVISRSEQVERVGTRSGMYQLRAA